MLEIGVKGGGQMTAVFSSATNFSDASKHYIVGPTVGLRLPFGLGVEFDALYRKDAYRINLNPGQAEFTASSWQFPVLVKYRFPGLIVHPFVDGGPVFQHLSYIGLGASSPDKGFALGGGVELKLGKIRISPEVRYTRWSSRQSLNANQPFNQNQADALVGVTF